MSDISEKLLEQAINSILHGSVQTVTGTDSYGNTNSQEIRVNDLRQPLVNSLAEKLVKTKEFKDLLEKTFTYEVIKKMQETILSKLTFNDLPYDIRRKIEDQMKNTNLEVKKYKLVAEVVDKD